MLNLKWRIEQYQYRAENAPTAASAEYQDGHSALCTKTSAQLQPCSLP